MDSHPDDEAVGSLAEAITREFGLSDLPSLGFDQVTQLVILANKVMAICESLAQAKRKRQVALATHIAEVAELMDRLATALSQPSNREVVRLCTRLNFHAKGLGELLGNSIDGEQLHGLVGLLQSDRGFYTKKFRSLDKRRKELVLESLAVAAGTLDALADILRNPDLQMPGTRPDSPSPASGIIAAGRQLVERGSKELLNWLPGRLVLAQALAQPMRPAFEDFFRKTIKSRTDRIRQLTFR